jgi:hypothetical protein
MVEWSFAMLISYFHQGTSPDIVLRMGRPRGPETTTWRDHLVQETLKQASLSAGLQACHGALTK